VARAERTCGHDNTVLGHGHLGHVQSEAGASNSSRGHSTYTAHADHALTMLHSRTLSVITHNRVYLRPSWVAAEDEG
jgi:hypothetical protein